MTLSELILLIHWEVQKSYNLVEELSKPDDPANTTTVHFGMEKFEITIPISVNERDMDYSEVNKNIEDERFRKFYYPLIIQSDKDMKEKKQGMSKGKVLDISVSSVNDKKPNPSERTGLMKITIGKVQS
jgi:hypothetical protein